MFARLPDLPGVVVTIHVDGEACKAIAGESVAAALLAAGRIACRSTPVSGAPRGPFCLMGACQECLVEIDGRANQEACRVPVVAGMDVRTQRGAHSLGARD